MMLSTAKTKENLLPALYDPQGEAVDPIYLVLKEVSKEKWENVTIITAGKIGQEYHKTFGHYHPENSPIETYKLLFGKGIFLLQKKHMENGTISPNKVEEVILVTLDLNEEISITADWGHCWINVGETPLVTTDTWRTGHTDQDYAIIRQQKGMAYYLIDQDGVPEFVPNQKYTDLPKPIFMTGEEFNKKYS
jgi:glucose-6-phosphate isomerase